MKKTKYEKCDECTRRKKVLNNQFCHTCQKAKTIFKKSGNKVIDKFIMHTLTNDNKTTGRMEYVPFNEIKDFELIGEGGFSKVYKATWIDGPINYWESKKLQYKRNGQMTVTLKKLNNSKIIHEKELLNELKVYYEFSLGWKYKNMKPSYSNSDQYNYVNKYFGLTQDPDTKDFMIITKYYESGDLTQYLAKHFFELEWSEKLNRLYYIIYGLRNIHGVDIIHQDFHSGNIFISGDIAIIGDLGISKPAVESSDEDEIYGIIPYVAPEIIQGHKYTKASDIYSFGMIMWELMTGRRPFWNRGHDVDLMIDICDGLRPPIVTNAPEGYIDLIQECWNPIPENRPKADEISSRIENINKLERNRRTEIIDSPDIGPITTNNPCAIYKSRSLSSMIESTRCLRSQTLKIDYRTKELDFDI